MSLHFHWLLPTNGDGRDIVGGGHGVTTGSAGVGLLRGGAGTALVGSHTEVADRIEKYVTEPELGEVDAAIARWAAAAVPLIRGALAAHETSDAWPPRK